jgi:4-amino-4-deoxy-L-arabinose transferase-like glycosyltransferase
MIAVLLRLGLALKFDGRFHQTDEFAYDTYAWQLASQGVLGSQGLAEAVPVVPSAFFALFYLFGHHLILPRLGQALISALTAWVIGRMTRELTGSERAGRLALAISAVYPFFIYYSAILMAETLYVACVVSGLWWLCASLRDPGAARWRPAASGAALALAALCRPEGFHIGLLLWAATAAACVAGRWPWHSWLLAALCWTLPLAAAAARNKAATGFFSLDRRGGIALLHGTILFDLNEIDTAAGMDALKEMSFYKDSLKLGEVERDRFYQRLCLKFMRDHPLTTLRQWGRKTVNFWRFYPRTDKVYHQNKYSDPGGGLSRKALVAISLLFEPWLIIGGLAGLWGLRRRWTELFPLGLFVAATMGVHLITVSQMRYRLPVMPLLIMGFCSLAAGKLAQSAKR